MGVSAMSEFLTTFSTPIEGCIIFFSHVSNQNNIIADSMQAERGETSHVGMTKRVSSTSGI